MIIFDSKKAENEMYNSYDSITLRMNSKMIFNDFLKNVNDNCIKEDGSCELFNIIDDYLENDSKAIRELDKGDIYYRARVINDYDDLPGKGIHIDDVGNTFGYGEGDSREAPIGMSSAGRNNVQGVSYLYLADRLETACAEVKPVPRQYISVAMFMLKKKLKIVDFSREIDFPKGESKKKGAALGPLFTSVMAQYTVPIANTEEYRATQVLTDHIRKIGVDGIAYRSFFDYKGTNYTIFNSSRDKIEFFGSKIVLLQSERKTILDYNDSLVRTVNTFGNAKYDPKFAKDSLAQLRRRILDI